MRSTHWRLRIAAICWSTARNAREGGARALGRGRGGSPRVPWRLIAAIIASTPTGGLSCRHVLSLRAARRCSPAPARSLRRSSSPRPASARPGRSSSPGLVSLTGSGSPFGPNSRVAHQAVVDQVNAAGGLLGRKLEYLAEDDQTNAEAGVRAARKLIDVDKVAAIMSVWASAVGTAVLPLCWENKVMLLGISAADSLAALPHQGYFVRTQPHTESAGQGVRPLHPRAGRQERLPDHAADAVHRDGVQGDPRDGRAEGRQGRERHHRRQEDLVPLRDRRDDAREPGHAS